MVWNYNPKDASGAMPGGEYPATLTTCEEQTSKAGNPMLKLVWTVYTPAGGQRQVFDYIVNPGTIWKMKKMAKAWGKLAEFDAGKFDPHDYLNANITLSLRVREDDQYGDKNEIDGYSASTTATPAKTAAPAKPTPSKPARTMPVAVDIAPDDIPF